MGLQSQAAYREMIDEILLVLEGDTEAVRAQVDTRMRAAAEALDFERAARLRDVIHGLDGLAREQRVQKVGGGDHDVVGLARDGSVAAAVILKVRSGRLLGRDTVRFHDILEENDAALLASFSSRYYLSQGNRRRASFRGKSSSRPALGIARFWAKSSLRWRVAGSSRVYLPAARSTAWWSWPTKTPGMLSRTG